MYNTSDFRKGLFIEIDKVPYVMVDFQHVKPGKGNQFSRTRIKNLLTGNTIDRTFKSGEQVGEPNLEKKRMQYLYSEPDGFQFMDLDALEQITLDNEAVGDRKDYLIEALEIEVLYFNGRPIAVDVPTFVNLKITYCEPSVKGDTATGGSKPVTMETGLIVHVPFHIKPGDVLKIDTRTGEYVEKIKS